MREHHARDHCSSNHHRWHCLSTGALQSFIKLLQCGASQQVVAANRTVYIDCSCASLNVFCRYVSLGKYTRRKLTF